MARRAVTRLLGVSASDPKRALLERLLKKNAAAPLHSLASSPARRVGELTPLSYAQERMWFLQQWEPASPVYNLTRAYRFTGRLDGARLARCLDVIAQRHESLRTSFTDGAAEPQQLISPTSTPAIEIVDMRRMPGRGRRLELSRRLAEQARRPFDLTHGPLLRLSLFQLGPRDHVLLLAAHQIIFDGRSLDIFYRELEMLYAAGGAVEGANLSALPVQYADYALWQRERQADAARTDQLAYWKKRLAGVLPVLDLPTDRLRTARSRSEGARRKIVVDKTVTGALKELSRKSSTTLFATLMAAYNILLYRYTGQEDIVVGFPVANRDQAELENLIGCFVNTLALRSDLSGAPSFRALLAQLRAALDGALKHRDLPFERLVEELAQPRELSRNPIFQTLFTFQNRVPAEISLAGIHAAPMDCDAGTAKFELTLALGERDGRLLGSFEYRSALFDRETIDRMIGHYQTLLKGIAADPDRSIAKLPLLTPVERKQILIDWNDTAENFSNHRCVHQLFEAQARRTPNRLALEFDGQRLSYRELNRRANRLARHLRKLGAGPEKLIGVCIERSLEMVVGLLAVLKAGAAYVALDPKYPRQRIEFMLKDADVEVLLTEQKLAANLPLSAASAEPAKANVKVVCLDGDGKIIARHDPKNLSSAVTARNLAYVIYTSGSAGQPKGVAIEHCNVVAFLHWAKSVFGADELSGVLASTSICFDLSAFELFTPLSWGGRVILVENALALSELSESRKVTLINTVPSALAELLGSARLPSSLKTVNLAGESLKPELVRKIYQSGTVEKVYDLYGPSETTTYSTFTLRGSEGRATIGRPIANTKIYLLDRALQPVPVGVLGELYIGGAGVARGYLNRPGLTQEKFVADPFAANADERLYRSGDLARYLPDGNIEYLGRADNQVKIRGYRIELGEIEAALGRNPLIKECAVVARETELTAIPDSKFQISDWQKELIAFVVPIGKVAPPDAELRGFLRQSLPEFMVPARFVALESLPLTPNGKVDRQALPALDGARPRVARKFAAAHGEIEELVAQIWREVLGLDEIGVEDNFFDLGGHSMLATRVAARLRGSFNIDLPLRKLFELPTISTLAAYVGELRRGQCGIVDAPILPVVRGGALPLSSAQQRLWFLHKLDPDGSAYNIPAAYRVSGVLDVVALHRALNEILRRHESLRTAIVEDHGRPCQKFLANAELTLPLVDLTQLSPEQADAEVLRLVAEDARLPYDLGGAPLLRAKLLRLGKEQHVIILNFHHIVADGSSLGEFYRELALLYDGLVSGSMPALPTLAVQYADYCSWQQEWLASPAAQAQLAYWRRQLSGALAPLELPADFPRPARQSYRGARLSRRLSVELTGALKSFSRREGATLFMTLLAAFNILLARLSGQRDIVIGSTIAGRSRPEVQGLIGFFINALALRSDVSGELSFKTLLQQVREICLDAYTHQELPFERIVEALNPARDLSRNPLFQVMFNMNETGARELKLKDCQSEKINAAEPAAKFDLILYAPEVDGAIELRMVYNADLFSAARMALNLEQLSVILEQALAAPQQSIESYSLVTPMSLRVLPDPTAPLNDRWEGAVQALISRQAQADPERLAVTDNSDRWSYRDLDEQSSQLANYFVRSGIRQDDVIAVYAQRSASLAVAIIAALKAGAVFVVLDPAYPAPRLLDYLRIARPRAWVELEPAGELSQPIIEFLAASRLYCRVNLPGNRSEIARLLDGHAAIAPEISLGADDPAYVAFTSGSTGQPKGVLCRHGPMSHFLPWQEEAFALDKSDRYCLLSGLGYNHLQREIFTALAGGAALFVPTGAELREPAQLARWLGENEITVLHLTPALGRLLCTAGEKLPAVRRIFFGGDALMRSDIAAMRQCAPNARIVSFYGATETQRAVGYHEISPHDGHAARWVPNIPIGKGAKDVQLLLMTADRQMAGVGELAELYIRSPHLAAGYLHDDELTAANFLANPFMPMDNNRSDRLYRSGELGRYNLDGDVEWVGRSERRANIRGYRVELAEVEAALLRHPAVRQAAVLENSKFKIQNSKLSEQLVAYVVADASARSLIAELRAFLAAKLPHYMVPGHFHLIQALPLGLNGKVDYAKLAAQNELDEVASSSEVGFEAPLPGIEFDLAEIFRRVLGVARIGRRDNFFHLGGHSLLAAQAAAGIRQAFGVGLDLRALFEAPTVEALAQRLEALRGSPAPGREEIEL